MAGSRSPRLLSKAYSRRLESEADLEGLRLYLKTGFEPTEAPKALNLLREHQTEFQQPTVDIYRFFDIDSLRPDSAWITKDSLIPPDTSSTKEDERYSTHPALPKRIKNIEEKLGPNPGKGSLFLVASAEEFDRIRTLAAFEVIYKYYDRTDYTLSAHYALIWLQRFPENKWLKGIVAQSLIQIAHYHMIENFRSVAPSSSDHSPYLFTRFLFRKAEDDGILDVLLPAFLKKHCQGLESEEILWARFELARRAKNTDPNQARKYQEIYLQKYPNGKFAAFFKSNPEVPFVFKFQHH
jgi:hypothetical protein